MKKKLVFAIAIFIIGLIACIVYINRPLSKDEVEELIYQQVGVVLSYEDSNNPLIVSLMDSLEINVEKVVKKSNVHLSTCKVSNHNFQTAYEKCMSKEYTTTLSQFTSDFLSVLNQEEKVYSTIQVGIKKNDVGRYQVELTEKDVDALTGGFISSCAKYYEKYE